MYRAVFEHHVALEEVSAFISKWKTSSDIIQKEPGALGSRLFRQIGSTASKEAVFYIMADWESKPARTTALANIRSRGIPIEGHNAHAIKTIVTEYELMEESAPSAI